MIDADFAMVPGPAADEGMWCMHGSTRKSSEPTAGVNCRQRRTPFAATDLPAARRRSARSAGKQSRVTAHHTIARYSRRS
jgi:hypothetical protein